jgi:hypothetical protein
MLAIWCELEGEDNKTCQHIYVDTAKVKGAKPEIHLPRFKFCGPFTKWNERIARNNVNWVNLKTNSCRIFNG